jgi:GMP synthase (glutamine-hydrolysing)
MPSGKTPNQVKMILILKTGSTLDNIKASQGDFEDWIAEKMQMQPPEYHVHSTGNYNSLPPDQEYSGIIITGSQDMVVDINLSQTRMHDWLLAKQKSGMPILGICFGHQLLNVLNGGTVEFNPSGIITGMEKTRITPAAKKDKLLGTLPDSFEVYQVHKQSIYTAPKSAEILAYNDSGVIDAIRFGEHSWGLQFHPEFDATIIQLTIQVLQNELNSEDVDVQELLNNVADVDYGIKILRRFKELTDHTL